jgi:hypothetical protein
VAVAEIHKAVAQAVKAGDLWLVFGNDSVWQERTDDALQLDATAKIYRQPTTLKRIRAVAGRTSQGCVEHGCRTEHHGGQALR